MLNTELDEIFLKGLEKTEQKNERKGKVIISKITNITDKEVFTSIDGKTECVIDIKEFEKTPLIGETVEFVLKEFSEDGIYKASKLEADKIRRLAEIHNAYKNKTGLKGKIKEVIYKDKEVKGFTVDLKYTISGFLPISLIDLKNSKPEEMIGKELDFAVIEYKQDNIVLSRKEYLYNIQKRNLKLFYEKYKEGDIVEGKVDSVESNFIIVDVDGVMAFLHSSEFSYKNIDNLKDVVKVGDPIKAKILTIDKEKNSIRLSKKALQPDPWELAAKKYSVGNVIKGKVIGYRREGVNVEIDEGVIAFLPNDELSWTEKVRNQSKYAPKGSIVTVKITKFDPEKKSMHLSLRELSENPWKEAKEKYAVNSIVNGVISSIAEFGVFVKFDDGIEGLVRNEDIDWQDHNKAKSKLKKGDKIKCVVLSIDVENEKLKLGIKQLSENPFKVFEKEHPQGSIVKAKFKKADGDFAYFTVDNMEVVMHISQYSKEKIDKFESVLKENDEIEAMIKRYDIKNNKIEISRKDYLNYQEKIEVEKYIKNDDGKKESIKLGELLKDSISNIKLESKNETAKSKEKSNTTKRKK